MSTIFTIEPYLQEKIWMFDDESMDFVNKSFDGGIQEIIHYHLYPDTKFKMLFSRVSFPNWHLKLRRIRKDSGEISYRDLSTWKEGNLDETLLKYFDKAPPTIYCSIEI